MSRRARNGSFWGMAALLWLPLARMSALQPLPAEGGQITLADDSVETLGNPKCWSADFNFSLCCGSEQRGRAAGCWNSFFNFQTCCVTPLRPGPRCNAANSSAELLWHCRVRQHREFRSCFHYEDEEAMAEGTLMALYESYDEYLQAQRSKSNNELDTRFFSRRALAVVARYISIHFGVSRMVRGLCHGAKTGEEVRELRRLLAADGITTDLLGTDISAEAAAASGGDVFEFDFHLLDMSWNSSWDFIYTNTLDHAYHPGQAMLGWRWTLNGPNGLLVLHRTSFHSAVHVDGVDVYGATVSEYCATLRATRYQILDIVRLPQRDGPGGDAEEDIIFAVRGNSPHKTQIQPVTDQTLAYDEAQEELNVSWKH